jgi:hypothetical protein
MNNKQVCISLLAFFTTFAFALYGQTSILLQPIRLKVHNTSVDGVLDELSRQTGYSFIYNVAAISPRRDITLKSRQILVRSVLDSVFRDTSLSYKEIDKYVIICKQQPEVSVNPVAKADTSFMIRGRVVETGSGQPLAYASVCILNAGYSLVANNEGRFQLRVPVRMADSVLCISYVGYQSVQMPVAQLMANENVFSLRQHIVPLPEIVIKNVDPENLLRTVIKRIPENYATEPFGLRAFYREAVTKDTDYISAAEAALDIYHSSYINAFEIDQLKVVKSRKFVNMRNADTVFVKVKESLKACLMLDLVKNIPDFLDEKNFPLYTFGIPDIVAYQGENAYVVPFARKESQEPPWYSGQIYISTSSLAILEIDFEVMSGYVREVSSQFIVRNKGKYKAQHKRIAYVVSYRPYNNKYYLNHTRCEMDISFRKRRHIFSKNYRVFFEMAVTDIDTTARARISRQEKYSWHGVFFDEIAHYEPLFWGNENVIIPEEKLGQTFKESTSTP